MSLRLPTRTLAPVLVLAVLGGVVATFMVARPPSSVSEEAPIVRPLPRPAPVKKAAPAKAKTKAPVAKKAAAKPTPAPVAVAKPKPAAPAVDDNGLPRILSAALGTHRVVVVGLYDPDSAVDRMALEEARAGAKAAGVGFVAVSVRAESQSRPLVELLGALENPGILVYRRPDTLFARIGGFADSETVAQAAANAVR